MSRTVNVSRDFHPGNVRVTPKIWGGILPVCGDPTPGFKPFERIFNRRRKGVKIAKGFSFFGHGKRGGKTDRSELGNQGGMSLSKKWYADGNSSHSLIFASS